ncbi:MAG: hypothetical protein BWK79_03630 [Beggiatoa sp. IS2]|nr:MAG: hypothetical protein BWK79_03630 [Beggiatoa sp. IS2]
MILTPFTKANEETTTLETLDKKSYPCSKEDVLGMNWIDRTQNYLSGSVCGVAIWFDRFFGGEREEEENIDRFVRLTNSFKWQQGEGFDFKPRVRARIQLPQFKKHLNLILSGEDDRTIGETLNQEDGFKEKDPNAKISNANNDKHDLGVRWNVIREPTSSFSISGKLRLNSFEIRPAIITRYRYIHGLGPYALSRTTQTVFWYKKEGFGETTRLDLERLITSETLLRWSIAGTYSEISHGIDWGMETSLFHEFSPEEAVSLDVAIWGATLPSIATENYRIGVRYRRNFYRPWLFFEIEPELSWPKINDPGEREITPAIMFRLEFLFGHKQEEI